MQEISRDCATSTSVPEFFLNSLIISSTSYWRSVALFINPVYLVFNAVLNDSHPSIKSIIVVFCVGDKFINDDINNYESFLRVIQNLSSGHIYSLLYQKYHKTLFSITISNFYTDFNSVNKTEY